MPRLVLQWELTPPPFAFPLPFRFLFPFQPMPPRFAFTASEGAGELQLGGFDPESVEGGEEGMVHFDMRFLVCSPSPPL